MGAPCKQKQTANAHTRKPKAVDWSNGYFAALATTCHCGRACEAAGVVYSTVWRRRKADPVFEAAYQDALKTGAELLEAEAVRRASEGLRRMKFNAKTGEAYIDPETGKPYIEHEYSDTLMLALLKRHFPEKYRERAQVEQNVTGTLDVRVMTEERRKQIIEQVRRARTAMLPREGSPSTIEGA